MTDRTVGHSIERGYIRVYANAYSIPEALALESALRQVAPAKAFQPVAQDATPELPPEVEALMDKANPPDPSDVLKNMEAHEERGE